MWAAMTQSRDMQGSRDDDPLGSCLVDAGQVTQDGAVCKRRLANRPTLHFDGSAGQIVEHDGLVHPTLRLQHNCNTVATFCHLQVSHELR